MSRERFEIFKKELTEDSPVSREDAFALYGYYTAWQEMGELTVRELEQLQALLGLTDDEVDDLTI